VSSFEQTWLNRGDKHAGRNMQPWHRKGMSMPNDLVELARICVKHSRASPHPKIAAQLMRMAKDYQCRATQIKASRQIDDLELNELFRNLFATAPSPEYIEAMRSVRTA